MAIVLTTIHLFAKRCKESVSVFHIEEKITLNTWDDIINRSCYESPVEPQQYRYVRVAAVYSFKDQSARYGVSDCLQGHRQGFLVITSDEKGDQSL